jgi:hypothetical protein
MTSKTTPSIKPDRLNRVSRNQGRGHGRLSCRTGDYDRFCYDLLFHKPAEHFDFPLQSAQPALYVVEGCGNRGDDGDYASKSKDQVQSWISNGFM